MKNSEEQKIIVLTKIRQYYLPVDAESYKILRDAGIPLIRIHENFIPTLSLLTKKNNIKARTVDFNDTILNPFLDKLGSQWQRRDHRKATINNSVLKFETQHQSIIEDSRVKIQQIEESLRRFFTRWGYNATYETSESRGKIKLHVGYKYSPDKMPIIHLKEDQTSLPVIRLELGFIRISVTLGEQDVETNVSVATGTTWTSLHTSRCLYSQVSDVKPFVMALMQVVNKDSHNSDNKIK